MLSTFDPDYHQLPLPPRGLIDYQGTVDELRSGQLRATTAHLSDFTTIEVSSDVVIVNYKAVASFAYGDTEFPQATIWATSVWARRAEEWKTVFYQGTAGE